MAIWNRPAKKVAVADTDPVTKYAQGPAKLFIEVGRNRIRFELIEAKQGDFAEATGVKKFRYRVDVSGDEIRYTQRGLNAVKDKKAGGYMYENDPQGEKESGSFAQERIHRILEKEARREVFLTQFSSPEQARILAALSSMGIVRDVPAQPNSHLFMQ